MSGAFLDEMMAAFDVDASGMENRHLGMATREDNGGCDADG